jgi:hypothetical protein
MSSRLAWRVSTTATAAFASLAAVSAVLFNAATTLFTSACIWSASSRTWLALLSDVCASVRTSSATTAKPRPPSPARAASMGRVQRQEIGLIRDPAGGLGHLADFPRPPLELVDDPQARPGDARRCARSRAPTP